MPSNPTDVKVFTLFNLLRVVLIYQRLDKNTFFPETIPELSTFVIKSLDHIYEKEIARVTVRFFRIS